MKKTAINKKCGGLLLLFSLIMYCFLLIFIFKGENQDYLKNNDFRGHSHLSTTNLDYVRLEGVEEKKIAIERDLESFNECSDVLGTSQRCEIKKGIEQPQLFCTHSSVVGEYNTDGIEVPKNAEIRVVEIHAPAALFAGSRAPYDNLVQINNPDNRLAFRNANEIIDPEFEFLMRQPPIEGFGGDLDVETGDTEIDKENFGMHAKASGEADGYVKFSFDVDFEAEKSVCPEVVNDGRFNVVKSNDIGKDLAYQVTPPELMDFTQKRENEEFCHEIPKKVIELDKENSFLLCNESFLDKFFNFWKGIWTTPRYNDDGNIIGHKKGWNISGILVDAQFGSVNECNEESCSIRYLEAARLMTSPPNYTDNMYPSFVPPEDRDEDYLVSDPVFLTTPCKIRVDHQLHDTKCYWDLSAWQHHFKLEETFTYPGFKNKIDEENYWKAVEAELKGTGWYNPSNGGGGTVQEFPNEDWLNHLRAELSKRTGLLASSPVDAQEFFGKNNPTLDDWVNLMLAISYFESGHNPNVTYKENFKNQHGEYVISTGLFQLSYASAAGYGYTVTTEQLKDPYLNIEIATVILETLVTQDNRIAGGSLKGASRYWAVLRQPKVNDIKKALK
jgi:hypothetical protein